MSAGFAFAAPCALHLRRGKLCRWLLKQCQQCKVLLPHMSAHALYALYHPNHPIRRVPLRAVLECVAATAPRYFLESQAEVCGGEGTPPPAKCGRRRFQVRCLCGCLHYEDTGHRRSSSPVSGRAP